MPCFAYCAEHAVLHNRLASENHSLKRNMGVYIAEAQRAKRTLQHSMQSRAAQKEHMVHDQHDVNSEYPQPAQLSQQHAQQASGEHGQLNRSSASWEAPKYTPSLQQTQECKSHQSRAEISRMSHQQNEPAQEGCSPCDQSKVLSQNESGQEEPPADSHNSFQLLGKCTEGTGMDKAERSGNAEMVTQALATAEASFALPSFCGSFHQQSPDAQLSQQQPNFGGNAAWQSRMQTDEQIEEMPPSHVSQTLHHWSESHQEEEEDGDRALQQPGRGETAEHGAMHDHAATVSDLKYRKQASPVAVKFAFARWAGH